MNKVVGRSAIILLLVLALVGGMVFFAVDYSINSGDWVLHEGSPHVYTDYSSVSGVITDRSGIMLMDTTDTRIYTQDTTLRSSLIHWLGDREGNIYAPMISHYAVKLTGHDLVNGLYVYGNDGGTITLTLSAQVQKAAAEALGDYKGTVAVYNYKTGEILCAVTSPNYDPDDVPDILGDTTGAYDGAYVNRFMQSTYTPGSIFKIVTSAAALEFVTDIDTWTFECTGTLEYGIDRVTCMKAHGKQNLSEAFLNSCNCAFAALSERIGGKRLQRYADQMGITASISFDGLTSAAGSIDSADRADVLVAWSAIGQHKDQINPCQFMAMMGAIANGGSGAMPYMVASVDGGPWGSYTAQTAMSEQIILPETAQQLAAMMRNNVQNYYGDENFPGLQVCAKSGTAELGGGKEDNALFAGFVADEEYPLAFIVIVENGGFGRPTCVPILSAVLQACKTVMDAE